MKEEFEKKEGFEKEINLPQFHNIEKFPFIMSTYKKEKICSILKLHNQNLLLLIQKFLSLLKTLRNMYDTPPQCLCCTIHCIAQIPTKSPCMEKCHMFPKAVWVVEFHDRLIYTIL